MNGCVTLNNSDDYLLGNSDAEHERLIRQANRLASATERFFREAGIALGSGCLILAPAWAM